MKKQKRILILTVSFLILSISTFGQHEKKSIDKKLLSANIKTVNSSEIGEELTIRFSNKKDTSTLLFVFINSIKIDTLEPIFKNSDYYKFSIGKNKKLKDSLSEEINPKNKCQILVDIFIGTDRSNKELIHKDFKLIFNKSKQTREWWSGITIGLLIIILLIIILRSKFDILRDKVTADIDIPPYSLSRTQMAFWTFIILVAYFVVWYNTGVIIEITGQVLALLGISAGTSIGAYLIDGDDIKNKRDRHQHTNDSKKFIMNILSDENGLSIHRLQNVFFSIAVASYFLYEVWYNNKIPELNDNLMILMGISSGTYLAIKKSENIENKESKDKQETPAD